MQASDDFVLDECGRVYNYRAEPVARLRIYNHNLSGITDGWIAYGWTVLDPENDRLLQITDKRIWHNRSVVLNGDLILFPTGTEPRNTRNGFWTLARLRTP